ncbi:Rieske (2Fe-2S) protein [Flindersiella endophytica]
MGGRSALDKRQNLAKLADLAPGRPTTVKGAACSMVVTRTGDQTAVAFSSACPHKGVVVTPDGERLRCPAHGALFNATTGAVERGPAEQGLSKVEVEVVGGKVRTVAKAATR